MSKLRSVKERQVSHHPFAGDLRGITNQVVSGTPFCFLTVRYLAASLLAPLADHFAAEIHPSNHHDTLHIICAIREAGRHKAQAIALFGLAVKCHDMFPQSQLLLGEADGLMHHLHDAIKREEPMVTHLDRQVHSWLKSSEAVSLEHPVRYTLRQANILHDGNSPGEGLAYSGLDQMHIDLFINGIEPRRAKVDKGKKNSRGEGYE